MLAARSSQGTFKGLSTSGQRHVAARDLPLDSAGYEHDRSVLSLQRPFVSETG